MTLISKLLHEILEPTSWRKLELICDLSNQTNSDLVSDLQRERTEQADSVVSNPCSIIPT